MSVLGVENRVLSYMKLHHLLSSFHLNGYTDVQVSLDKPLSCEHGNESRVRGLCPG